MSKFTKDEAIEQVRDVLERMPRMGQESDQPLESILTMWASESILHMFLTHYLGMTLPHKRLQNRGISHDQTSSPARRLALDVPNLHSRVGIWSLCKKLPNHRRGHLILAEASS